MPAKAPALSRFNPAQPGARGMKIAATGLLVFMAAVFFAARHFEAAYPALGYVKAFAEAAMVGGLADWFAVTALFRHPLGLPIPHTAIIPRNKDRIGEALARFLTRNFLIPRCRAADAQHRRRRRCRALSQGPPRARAPHPRRRLAPHRRHLRKSRRRAAGRDRKSAISTRLRKMKFRRCSATRSPRDQRGPPRADARAAIRWTARALDANEP